MRVKLINVKSKKGQFYILTAIIFCSVMFTLLYNRQPIPKVNPEFENLYNNYIHEAPIVINNALYENKNLSSSFQNYTSNFMAFAKEKNINFKVFYVLVYDNKIELVNYLNAPINIESGNILLNISQKRVIEKIQNLTVDYQGTIYNYNISDENVQFKFLVIKQ